MRREPADPSRRQALKLVIGGAAVVPLGSLLASAQALAADLPHLSEDDPVAVSLKYKHDATQAPRVEKAGTPADQQLCSNCQLAQGEGEWLGCSIFPGKAVSANGWCTAWLPRSG
jgi:hypothetical protein